MGIGGLCCCPKCNSKEAENTLKTSINLISNPIIKIPEDEPKNNFVKRVKNIDNNYEDNEHNPNEENNNNTFTEKKDIHKEKINHSTKIKTTLSNKDNNEEINEKEKFDDKSQIDSVLKNSSTITSGIIQKGLINSDANNFHPKESTNQFILK